MPVLGKSFSVSESKALPSVSELRQQQDLQEFMMTRLEFSFTPKVAALLNKYTNESAVAAGKFGPQVDIEPFMRALHESMVPVYENQYDRTATLFGDDVVDSLSKSWRIPQKKDQGGIFAASLSQFIETNAAERVTMITDTTRVLINSAIQQATEEQTGPAGMAKLIRQASGGIIAARRAKVIARTETHSAAQFGSNAAALSTGLQLRKFWVDSRDERTRPDHVQARKDSRRDIVTADQPFNVGGEALMYPGDPAGSAEQIVNCRCASIYRPILD
jgi:hypothetical protein